MTGVYRIAGVNVEIHALFPRTLEYCEGYRTDGPADFVIETTPREIEEKRRRIEKIQAQKGAQAETVSDGYLEFTLINLKIAELMPQRGIFLIHGSAIAVDGACYLFSARSGTGKSTHAAMWLDMLGERAVYVNDDKPYIRVQDDGAAIAYGSPWCGKHRRGNDISAPLKAICFLERAGENWIREMSQSEAVPQLYLHVYRPTDPAALAQTMALVAKMNVKFFRLGCTMDSSAAELAYNTMKG